VDWAEDFIDQFSAFPAGKHDDMVDSATQALSYLIWSAGSPPGRPPEEDEAPDTRAEALLDNERCYQVY